MSDPQQRYGGQDSGPEAEVWGYDEYGRPLTAQPPPAPGYGHPAPPGHADGTGGYAPHGGYGHDPFGGRRSGYDPPGPRPAAPVPPPGQDPWSGTPDTGYPYHPAQDPASQDHAVQDYAAQVSPPRHDTPYGTEPPPGQQPPPPTSPPPAEDPYGPVADRGDLPHPRVPHDEGPGQPAPAAPPVTGTFDPAPGTEGGAPRLDGTEGAYRTEQFAFVEDRDDAAEDVIDWLKFSESRTERRDERRRRNRNRLVALLVVAAVVLASGVGYLLWAGKVPGLGGADEDQATADGQQRDVIVVHLRQLDTAASATVLLVDNADAERGAAVLLPNNLAVTVDRGSTTTLGQAVEEEGAAPTREALGALLGAEIKGTWRLDTPYLENLVELVGGVTVDTNTTVPGEKKGDDPAVRAGRDQELDGSSAVAYATWRAPGEPQRAQLVRFGQVMHAVLRELPTDPDAATRTLRALHQVPDPSLDEAQLGASLAQLAQRVRDEAYESRPLPVEPDGTLSERTSQGLVREVLGGTVRNADPDAAVRVALRVAGATREAATQADATLVNSGYHVVGGGDQTQPRTTSVVTYATEKAAKRAQEVARTLGLPKDAVREQRGAANADVTVVLGSDFEG